MLRDNSLRQSFQGPKLGEQQSKGLGLKALQVPCSLDLQVLRSKIMNMGLPSFIYTLLPRRGFVRELFFSNLVVQGFQATINELE